jgi:hypothetical protein
MPFFDGIARFLKNPRNADLAEKYHVVADELKGQLIVHQEQFESFEHALDSIPRLIQERSPELQVSTKRRLLKIMVHYSMRTAKLAKNHDSPRQTFEPSTPACFASCSLLSRLRDERLCRFPIFVLRWNHSERMQNQFSYRRSISFFFLAASTTIRKPTRLNT